MAIEQYSMATRAVGAGAWTVGTRLAAKLVDLAMLLCLARFLGPAEFGLVAMAMAAVFIVEALFELPMAAALIRIPTLTPALLHTAFTLSLLRGILIALLLLAVSLPLAAFNDEPRLKALLAVLAFAPALRGLISPRMVEFSRAFNFRPDAVIELSGKAAAFGVSVLIAVTTHSYWAIAAVTVCGPLVSTLMSYYVAPLRPRLTLVHWAYFSNLIGWNFLSQLFMALSWQIDRIILPRFTPTAEFGQYAMSKQLAEIPFQALIAPLARPVMAALASTGNSKGSRYVQLAHAIALVMVPVMGFPLVWPEVLVHLALGPAWLPAVEWLRWLAAAALLGLPAVLLGPLAMTLDRPHWVAVRTFIELVVRLPLVWVGAAQYGVQGAIAGSAISSVIGGLTSLFIVKKLASISVGAQLKTLITPFVALTPAAAVLYFSLDTVTASANSFEFVAFGLFFGIVYVLTYMLFAALAWWFVGLPPGLERHCWQILLRYKSFFTSRLNLEK